MNDTGLAELLEKIADHEKRIVILEQARSPSVGDKNQEDPNGPKFTLSIANKIVDCEESALIQDKVLDRNNMEARILLCFYISYKYFANAWLTSGDIEKITSELGIKMDKGNISNKLRVLRRYLESQMSVRYGRPTPYRLNRAGSRRFEEIIQSKTGELM